MKDILLLIRAITLLFRESQLDIGATSSPEIVKEVAETVKPPEMAVGSSDNDRDMVMGLRSIAVGMATNPEGTKYVADDLLQRVRLLTRHDESLYDSLKEGIVGEMSEESLKLITGNIRQELNVYLREVQALNIIKENSRKASFDRDSIGNLPEFIANFRAALEQYETNVKEKDPAIVGEVKVSDGDRVEAVFQQAKELNNEDGIMKTGWQALNRMLQGGFRRGEECVIGALQHNFKTGFTLSLFKQIALYNVPYMIDKKKKPLLLRITFEDPLSLNFPFLFRNIKENETGEHANVVNTPVEEMAAFVQEKLTVNGYEIMMVHVNPSMWGYRDIQNYVLSLEAEGYEIHMLMLDYLNMVDKRGLDNTGPTGSNIRDLFRRMRNFCAPRKITLITPHQLSTEAKMLIRQGNEESFVKDIANKGYYDSCRTLDQEVDLEIYIHIVKADGKSWLTIQRGKHRLIQQTKEEYKFCVLPFEDIGDIRDDVNGKDTSRKKPAGPMDGEKPGFWDFDPL
ncbi:putative DnaB helicase [Ralstonia phage RP31]|uniref:Putative DnaB helicase n=2 Tax=Ripduovirus RP12 TaxID=2560700 RepID=A0A1L7N0S2_9CAUD|nr:DnaB-like replicative helicase [Ralstonia phage RP12]BAW19070.1 putative DnaB helicase [Ralstonia phage RP12]BAW19355.1 putative DnaB helicase [Ralstonia phage RP31]